MKRIESKWYRLSRKTKLCWEQAAEVLLESARVGRSLFASAMERDISCTPGCPGEQWPGPLDFCDADEIHGTELEPEPVKVEVECDVVRDDFPLVQTGPKQEENQLNDMEITKPSQDCGTNSEIIVETVMKRPGKHLGYLNIARNKKGRWEAPKAEVKTFHCKACAFTTVTEWKLKRHEGSSKHLNRLEELKRIDNNKDVSKTEVITEIRAPEDLGDTHERALGGLNWDHSYGTLLPTDNGETKVSKDEAFVNIGNHLTQHCM